MNAFLILNTNSYVQDAIEAVVIAVYPETAALAIGAEFIPDKSAVQHPIVGMAFVAKEKLEGDIYKCGQFSYPVGQYEKRVGLTFYVMRIPRIIRAV